MGSIGGRFRFMWQHLTANLAAVALFVSGWNYVQPWLEGRSQKFRLLVFGCIMGWGALASMLLTVEVEPGVLLDLRTSLVATAGLFAGMPGALVATAFPLGYRIAIGGHGLTAGLIGIAVAFAAGVLAHRLIGRRQTRAWQVLVFAVCVGLSVLVPVSILPQTAAPGIDVHLVLPLIALNIAATAVAGLVVLHTQLVTKERDLLRAAVAQAPDFYYVKNARGQFVAVNQTVATYNGYDRPVQMTGKTDFDIADAARARILSGLEQKMLKSGEGIADFEEQVPDLKGNLRWFSTSKTPLRDADGNVIGLVGVTRDITGQKQLEQTLLEAKNQLSYALSEMSDGLAMFDAEGVLVFCNQQYRELFPLTGDLRVPGTRLRDILEAVTVTGEQVGIPKGHEREWIDAVVGKLHTPGEQQIKLFDGHWLMLRTRPTQAGLALVVVSDITEIKSTEGELTTLSNQLAQLANTDPLLGVGNRRAFDQALAGVVADTSQSDREVALLLIDVDSFKAYNDRYGHLAGDECLRQIADCLRQRTRAGDFVARYGGEEFAVILPETSAAGAMRVADNLRAAVRERALEHDRSERKVVTISVGVATSGPTARHNPTSLILQADKALYAAKAGGRDATRLAEPDVGFQPIPLPRKA
ncbi:diguanylate cyclase [Mesorhizobium sp. M2D.F.Ca.ET.185.01.1.1]|nr:diguanylate cyclase [Mesorhizobium sp. M2D.F.Ca.ET.140.01.1.1]TGP20937.1 diguanylate cyclase [Mesorhizobium sp. M2D.F.Ca.ET.233.01.1.1]TGP27935.1 diguanylate cyclase [Mesorhizobium sp. M2D.F.Ca.ET.232.01.1.1]TGP49147.1 diguanylate cyclase [bacterium M00.F.Ca.ET.230.01.1.1]TGP58672.1 diguanylate cyclase [Mesorhizobium sp. M2D.F.Ca.ET.226.01.1.1]TGP67740.1 diguanylate cyclase [Mesorhizobium sp. M2D.F.Ca.ET.225.01.1.1]TGP80253.1 diguanylate cyclase [bacterium M00.F.Ca.ET.227.01.1.1]TGP81442.